MNDLGFVPFLVSILRDGHAMEALMPAWHALWLRVPNATPFQSPAWLLPWWRRLGWGEPWLVAIFAGERLVALAPLFIAERKLRMIGLAVSDYLDVLIDPAVPQAAPALSEALLGDRAAWDEAWFTELAPDAGLLGLPAQAALADHQFETEPCPVLSFAEGDFRAALPRRMRRNLDSAWCLADRLGTIAIATGPPVFERLVALHGARWKGRGDGMLTDADVLAFHREAIPHLAELGLLRLYGIEISGRMVAAYYGFLHRRRAYAYLTGFDPSVEGQSLGTLALGHALAEAACEGASEFHFLRGNEPYKYSWGGVDRHNRSRIWSRA
jgi:CelD/BcsL family acetyltransferase involved in cellulose biosynthesis